MSIFGKLKRSATDAVQSAVKDAAKTGGIKKETITFTALPESLAQMQALS